MNTAAPLKSDARGADRLRIDALIEGVTRGHAAMLGRAISMVEAGGAAAAAMCERLPAVAAPKLVAGITGPPGSGKSTLINACVQHWRHQDRKVAVIAVDPSSPISGGAVLGDRARMGSHSGDSGVFIRSLSTLGHMGGLSEAVDDILLLLRVSPFDIVLLETVGAGQSETEVSEVADVSVVVSAPGLGDEIQAIKAGILEIADILVVNKHDLAGADATKSHLLSMLKLRTGAPRNVQVLTTDALRGEGVSELVEHIESADAALLDQDRRRKALHRLRKRVARAAAGRAAQRVEVLVEELGDEHFPEDIQNVDVQALADELLASVLQGA